MSLIVSLQAGGYGRRFGSDVPKPLLPLGSGVVLDHVYGWVHDSADEIYLTVNSKHTNSYHDWAKGKDVKIHVDGHSTPEEDKYGSVGGMMGFFKSIERRRTKPDRVLVMSTDEVHGVPFRDLLDFRPFTSYKNPSVVLTKELGSIDEARNYGIVNTSEDGKVVECEEKPQHPKSKTALLFCYLFNTDTLPHLLSFNSSRKDAAADMIDYVAKHTEVFAFPYPKNAGYFHITNQFSYEEARSLFEMAQLRK